MSDYVFSFLNLQMYVQYSEFPMIRQKCEFLNVCLIMLFNFFLDSWEISKKNTRNWHSTVTSVKAKLPGRLLSSHSQQTITSQQQKKISRANQKAENKCSTQQQMIIIHLIADNLHLISEDALSVLYQTIIIHLKADNLFSIPKKAHST